MAWWGEEDALSEQPADGRDPDYGVQRDLDHVRESGAEGQVGSSGAQPGGAERRRDGEALSEPGPDGRSRGEEPAVALVAQRQGGEVGSQENGGHQHVRA